LGKLRGIATALTGLAGLSSEEEQPRRAARLLGASEALNSANGSAFDPVDRVEYDRILAATRARLDQESFDAAWSAGQAITLDQAIAEALGH
jgi:hypothetical protein